MKIFYENAGKEEAYIQIKDLIFLLEQDKESNENIYSDEFYSNINELRNKNPLDFVRFTENLDICFFKKCDFIIDVKEAAKLSISDIEERHDALVDLLNSIRGKLNKMNKDQQKITKMIYEYNRIYHKVIELREITNIKLGAVPKVALAAF